MLLHEASESGEIGRDTGDAHHSAFSRGVAPWLIVAGKHAQVAAADKFFIVQTEEGVGGREELGVEDYLKIR